MRPTASEAPPPGVRLEWWRLDEPPEVVAFLAKLLSPDERDRAAAFTRPDARRRFVVARGRLRERLAAELGAPPAELAFRYGPTGKPAVEGAGGLGFNLAHSGDVALLALAEGPVGIDVERLRPLKDAEGLARRWFHPREVARIDRAEDPLGEFFATWVAKEAALKLVGVGVGESLPRVATPARAGWAEGLPPSPLGLTRCWVEPVPCAGACVAAVATPGGLTPRGLGVGD